MLASSLLAYLQGRAIGVDTDVDAPDLKVWLPPSESQRLKELRLGRRAAVKKLPSEKPAAVDKCPHGALSWNGRLVYKPYLCEGCGLCALLNPEIFEMRAVKNGEIWRHTHGRIIFYEGRLMPGFTGSGKIVEAVLNEVPGDKPWVIDGAPGTGCPVNAALRYVDKVILVMEESLSGLADMRRVQKVVEHFKKPYAIVVNKHGLNPSVEVKALARIPYDQCVRAALEKRRTVYEFCPEVIRPALSAIRDWLGW